MAREDIELQIVKLLKAFNRASSQLDNSAEAAFRVITKKVFDGSKAFEGLYEVVQKEKDRDPNAPLLEHEEIQGLLHGLSDEEEGQLRTLSDPKVNPRGKMYVVDVMRLFKEAHGALEDGDRPLYNIAARDIAQRSHKYDGLLEKYKSLGSDTVAPQKSESDVGIFDESEREAFREFNILH